MRRVRRSRSGMLFRIAGVRSRCIGLGGRQGRMGGGGVKQCGRVLGREGKGGVGKEAIGT